MKIFSFRSLLFYGLTIVSVILLFSVTTTYGEKALKAATPIAGRYQLTESDCLKGATLRLDQSGRYLTAAIELPNQAIKPPVSLSGTWSGVPTAQGIIPLTLSGTLPEVPSCAPTQKVWFQGQIKNKSFSGKLIFANGDRSPFRSQLDFTPSEKSK